MPMLYIQSSTPMVLKNSAWIFTKITSGNNPLDEIDYRIKTKGEKEPSRDNFKVLLS